jgi:hypothetical protein
MPNRQPGELHRNNTHRLVSRALLEAVSPPLLARFLRPFDDFLATGDLASTEEISDAWLTKLHACLATGNIPLELADALLQIDALMSEEGHDGILLHAAAEQLDLFASARRLSTADLALTLYLDHRDAFRDTEAVVQSEHVARFVEFCGISPNPSPRLGSTMLLGRLEIALREWFASRNRTSYVEVHVFETPTEYNFHIVHGRPPRRRSVITANEQGRESLSFIPDKEDLVIYDLESKKLSVNAQFPLENNFYRRAIGDVYFGNAEYFQPRSVFTGAPLQEEGPLALSPEGIDGLRGVRLCELTVEQPGRTSVLFKGVDLAARLASEHDRAVIREGQIAQMRFDLELANRARPLKVEVSLPNKLTYDRRIAPTVVRAFLRKRGFRAVREDDATG